jgi:hypothetical protein
MTRTGMTQHLEQSWGFARNWGEILLPLYSLVAVFIYFRPDTLPEQVDGSFFESAVVWALWGLIATLTGVLAVSAVFVAFYVLYSPFYLAQYVARQVGARLGGNGWVDPRERRFYAGCFGLLCLLLTLAFADPSYAAVAFILLSGTAPLLWRALV